MPDHYRRGVLLSCAALVTAAAMIACGVNRRPIVGRDIEVESVRAIVPNETTVQQVIDRFGTPDAVLHYADGSEEYRYSYTGWIDRKVGVPGASHVDTEKEHEALILRIESGRVISFNYLSTANPEDNLAK